MDNEVLYVTKEESELSSSHTSGDFASCFFMSSRVIVLFCYVYPVQCLFEFFDGFI